MLNLNIFITEEEGTFYFDADEYNSKTDIPLEDGDLIKFNRNGKKYFAKVVNIGTKKNYFYVLEILKVER